jgi:hypothetical protein
MEYANIQHYPVRCTTCGTTWPLQLMLFRRCGAMPNHLGSRFVDPKTGHPLRIEADDDHVVGVYDHGPDQCDGYWCPILLLRDYATGDILATGLLAFNSR